MPTPDPLLRGRKAFEQRAWAEVVDRLADADRRQTLGPADLERLGTAAFMAGRDDVHEAAFARAYDLCAARGDAVRAARSAFWAAFGLMNRGQHARAGGWLARARRLVDSTTADCAERGFLLLPAALQHAGSGDFQVAYDTFEEAAGIGERCGNRDLVSLARQGAGRALIRLGDIPRGVALLDEAMLAVVADHLSPMVAGTVYCSVIDACAEIADVRRAQEWTGALGRWCESQPGLVAYRGECMARRAEVLQLNGKWREAATEAEQACARLSPPAVSAAFYRLGEIHRLRGESAEAEAAYRRAGESGGARHPGLALLWLAQRRIDDAVAAMARVKAEARDRRAKSRILPAIVEIQLAAGDLAAARGAADELATIAEQIGTAFFHAMSAHATGSVVLAEGNPGAALEPLRTAHRLWRDLGLPYEGARVGLLVAEACRQLGDVGSARLELDAARAVFESLWAAPDLARARDIAEAPASPAPGGLTARERQVLTLIASGRTNRAIARELGISEKTVARHVSNIFDKLDLSSRTAATAYAFRHRLV